MSSIFKNQDYLTIRLDTNVDISSATSREILYQKPDGSTGEWDAVLYGTTQMEYLVEPGDLDQAGEWQFQSKFVLNGETGYGEKAYKKIDKNLD